MEALLQNLRYAFRGLRRNLGFCIIVVLTLGLGIGANTAVFSTMESVLLRPLPFQSSERLVSVWAIPKNASSRIGTSGPEFEDYKEQNHSFEYLANIAPRFTYTLTGEGEPRSVVCTGISYDFFPMLGLQPFMGRLYRPDEYHVDGVQVVISQRFWKEQLGSDPHVLGKMLNLDGTPQVVIGIMPPVPDLFPDTDIWAKMVPDFPWMQVRGNKLLTVIGRLKPGVTAELAEQELSAILHRGPGESPDVSVQLIPLKDELVGKVRSQLEIVMAAVALVLFITCVNVAYLLLARNTKRLMEIAIRLSVGATHARILKQFVTENLVLAFLGGAIGLLLATQSTRLLTTLNAGILPRAQAIGIDAQALAFALAITVFTSVFLGCVPSFAISRLPIYETLKAGRGQMGSVGKSRFRMLLVSEVALTIVLLVAAGLLLRSFWRVGHMDPGFQPENLLTAHLRTSDTHEGRKFFTELMRRSADLPGVRASALSDCMPAAAVRAATLRFDDRPNDPYNIPTVQSCWISPDYFRAIGAPMMEGRSFTLRDDETGPPVVIINKAMADLSWPKEIPIGKHIGVNPVGAGRINTDTVASREIVGVVGNLRQKGLEAKVEPAIYMPYQQDQTDHVFAAMNWFARSAVDPRSLSGTFRAQVRQIRPSQPIERMQTMEEAIFKALAFRRFILSLFGSFSGLALLLSAIGIFGMIAYSVSQRIPEMGVRIALGAQPGDIRQLVLKEGLLLILCGVMVGALIASLLTRAMSGLLFGVKPSDPFTFVVASGLLLIVGTAACLLPAWRAGSVDPLKALRMD